MLMSCSEFHAILKDSARRAEYQVVDVREADELRCAKLNDNAVFNLSLGALDEWSSQLKAKDYERIRSVAPADGSASISIDPSKPTIVLCHHGMRSRRGAVELGMMQL
jgi:rhodanese-related sulfurtransferase